MFNGQPQLAPSLLAADFAHLGSQAKAVIDVGAKALHLDVMDGHFVPPITFGPLVVEALRFELGSQPFLDVHLMIEKPECQLEAFAAAGASAITVHAEATAHTHRCLQRIRELGCAAGLAVCPGTPLTVFEELRGAYDFALCMTVNPGWGGQRLIPETLAKVRRLVKLIDDPKIPVGVDGGVDDQTVASVLDCGALWIIAGSSIYNNRQSPADNYQQLLEHFR